MNEPQILKQDKISNETQITNGAPILKKDQISNDTQITNEPQI